MPPYPRVTSILLLLVLIGMAACSGCQDESAFETEGQSANTKQVTVEITGMSCAKGCAPRVREALATLPWAKNVQVDFDRKQATFTAQITQIDETAIRKVLEEAGFEGQVKK